MIFDLSRAPQIRIPLVRPVEQQYLNEETLDLAFHRMSRLSPIETFVIVLVFGLLGGEAWSIKKIAKRFGVWPSYIHQVKERALTKLRYDLAG